MSALEIVGLEWLGALALFLAFILLVRYLDHRERMAMIDRGLVPPQRWARTFARPGSAALRGGLITAMVGLAVTLGLYTAGYLLPPPFNAAPGRLGPWLLPGLIPLFVGLALIASHYLAPPAPRNASHPEDESEPGALAASEPRAAASTNGRRLDWRLLGRGATAPDPDAHEHDDEAHDD
jgi:hypothetical protein